MRELIEELEALKRVAANEVRLNAESIAEHYWGGRKTALEEAIELIRRFEEHASCRFIVSSANGTSHCRLASQNGAPPQETDDALREKAEATVLAVRGSYDAPGFDACVDAEIDRLRRERQQPQDTHTMPDGRPIFGEGSPHDVGAHLAGIAAQDTHASKQEAGTLGDVLAEACYRKTSDLLERIAYDGDADAEDMAQECLRMLPTLKPRASKQEAVDENRLARHLDGAFLDLGRLNMAYRARHVNKAIEVMKSLGYLHPAAKQIDSPQVSREVDEYGWVIEHIASDTADPEYWCGYIRGEEPWQKDHNKAVRFARYRDAEIIRDTVLSGGCHRICQHIWTVPKASLQEQSR